MATPAAGQVVLLRFPFSDLSQTKLRPALILAAADRGDWIVCQITSNPFGDAHSIQLDQSSFAFGSLSRTSFSARQSYSPRTRLSSPRSRGR
jgi:mRNA interferase MazF